MSLAVDQQTPGIKRNPIITGVPVAAPLFDLTKANETLAAAKPEDIIRQALSAAEHPLISTSFSAYSAALLHMVQKIQPDITVLWCDTGFNTPATYRLVEKLVQQLNLNLKIYQPRLSAGHLEARYGGVPGLDTPEHKTFTQTVKLEPFKRAFEDLKPDLWITGIRHDETEFRKTQNIFTWDARRLVTKVAPTFHWSTGDLADYITQHNLPYELDYLDPTKPKEHMECGLHY